MMDNEREWNRDHDGVGCYGCCYIYMNNEYFTRNDGGLGLIELVR